MWTSTPTPQARIHSSDQHAHPYSSHRHAARMHFLYAHVKSVPQIPGCRASLGMAPSPPRPRKVVTEEPIKKVLAEGESLWEGASDSANPFGRHLLPGNVANQPLIHPQISPRNPN